MSGVKGCGLGRPGLLRMSQNNCYFGLRDLTRVSCWSSCFSGVSLDVSSFVCHTISPAAFVSPLLGLLESVHMAKSASQGTRDEVVEMQSSVGHDGCIVSCVSLV